MNIRGLIEEAEVFDPSASLSHVISHMINHGDTEVFLSDSKFRGVVGVLDILKRSTGDPSKMRISRFMRKFRVFAVDEDPNVFITHALLTEYRSLPVVDDENLYTIRKHKLIGFLDKRSLLSKPISYFVHTPGFVRPNETLAKVKTMMKTLNVTRLPVVNEKNMCVGLIEAVDVLRHIISKQRSRAGELSGEKIRLSEVKISPVFEKTVIRVEKGEKAASVAKRMKDEGIYTVIVEGGGKFVGMVTVKEILKLSSPELRETYARLSGMDEEDEFTRAKAYEMIENLIRKLSKFVEVNYGVIHVETHRTTGKRMIYEVDGRFVTNEGRFYASDSAWDPLLAVKRVLDKIEREIKRSIERSREHL